jgi:small subunit ribosomal protein S1
MTEERTDQNGAPVAEADVGAEERLDAEAVPAETDSVTSEAEIATADAESEIADVDGEAEAAPETEQADADPDEELVTESTPMTESSAASEDFSYLDMDDSEYSSEEYEEMLAMYDETMREIAEGEIVQATIVRITDGAAILDVGFKSEGSVPLDEFRDPSELEAGDKVEVFLESLEDQEGVVVLSKKKADFLRVWEKIKTAFDDNQAVPGMIKRKIKGGATVDLMGVDAFLPGSQIALRRVHNIEDLIGQEYDFKILKLNKRRRNIVVSRRVILEDERAGKRDELKEELEVGQIRTGVVKNITDFGAFIDLGGMDGLLHITDMSWGRVGHPSEVCDIGQDLEVKILDIDWDRERISLGLKQLQPYPWKDVADKYPVGTRVRGKVVSITNYGAFIELEKGVEGLVHISEMSWTRNVRHPSQLVAIGEEVECVVLRVDEEDQKISLGMKQTEEDPWLSLPNKYPPGTRIKGVVRNLTSFGAFVEVEPGIDGLVHISDMSWTRRVQHPSEVMRKGEEVEVMVLSIDPEQKRISLGLKQTEEDPWYELAQRYDPGKEVTGQVARFVDKGIVVDLGGDVEGFVPASQLGVEEPLEDPSEYFVEGQDLELKVLESDPVNRRIVLAVTVVPERRAVPPPEVEEVEAEAEVEEVEAEAEVEEVEAEAEVEEVEAEAEVEEVEAEAEVEDVEAEAEVEDVEAEAEVEEVEAEAEVEEVEAEAEVEEVEAEAEVEEVEAEAEVEDVEVEAEVEEDKEK